MEIRDQWIDKFIKPIYNNSNFENEVRIYPNPASDILNLQLPEIHSFDGR